MRRERRGEIPAIVVQVCGCGIEDRRQISGAIEPYLLHGADIEVQFGYSRSDRGVVPVGCDIPGGYPQAVLAHMGPRLWQLQLIEREGIVDPGTELARSDDTRRLAANVVRTL